jgi:hypothetical protein
MSANIHGWREMSHRTRRLVMLSPLLAAALALGACGTEQTGDEPVASAPAGDGNAASPAGGNEAGDEAGAAAGDPCKLLTAGQARKALKVDKVAPGEVDGGLCIYSAVPAVPAKNIGAGLNGQAKNEAELQTLLDQGDSQGLKSEKLSGIGDAAYLVADANLLHVVVDGTPYLVSGLADRGSLTRAAKSLVANVS